MFEFQAAPELSYKILYLCNPPDFLPFLFSSSGTSFRFLKIPSCF